MNIEEMEKELNQLMKRGQELIEKLKEKQDCLSNFDVYEINFNGKIERFYCSKEIYSFDGAQSMIRNVGKRPVTVSELWDKDEDGIERWRHLKNACCNIWVWCQEYSDSSAYYVYLHLGGVLIDTRTANYYALCY